MPTGPNPLPPHIYYPSFRQTKNTRQPPCRRVFCHFICFIFAFTPFMITKYTFFRLF